MNQQLAQWTEVREAVSTVWFTVWHKLSYEQKQPLMTSHDKLNTMAQSYLLAEQMCCLFGRFRSHTFDSHCSLPPHRELTRPSTERHTVETQHFPPNAWRDNLGRSSVLLTDLIGYPSIQCDTTSLSLKVPCGLWLHGVSVTRHVYL